MSFPTHILWNNPGGFSLSQMSGVTQATQLQNTISAATSGIGELPPSAKHHPITCTGPLGFDEEGIFSCDHGEVPPDDRRTKACLIHSLANLLIEEAYRFTKMEDLPYNSY